MSPFLLDNLATISLIAPRPSKTCPYDVNRTVAERGASLIMRVRYDYPKVSAFSGDKASGRSSGAGRHRHQFDPRKIIIFSRETTDDKPKESTYAKWKVAQYNNQ